MKHTWTAPLFVSALFGLLAACIANAEPDTTEPQQGMAAKVRTLIARYQTHKPNPTSDWDSPVDCIMIFSPPTETGQPGPESATLIQEIRKQGLGVLEPAILAQTIQALQLTPAQWLDPTIQKQLAASAETKVIITLTPTGTNVQDAQTGETLLQLTHPTPDSQTAQWAERIAKVVKTRHPLQGRILNPDAGEVIINLGSRHGVTPGMVFNVLSDSIPIDLADGIAEFRYEWLGRIRVTRTEQTLSFAQPESRVGIWSQSQKITSEH